MSKSFIRSTIHKIGAIRPLYIFFGVVLTTLAVYISTLSSYVYYGDSGEFVVTGLINGVAHPPGFPLFVAIAHQFSKLPINSVSWRISLVSAIFGALSAGILFKTVHLITQNKIIGIASAFLYAFAPLIWTYNTTAEVFSINNFFISLLLYMSVLILTNPDKQQLFPISMFIFSLGLTGHQLSLFFAPVFIYILIKLALYKKPKILLYSFFAVILGQLPQLYMWYAASNNPFYNWGDPDTPARLINHILRRDYGTFKLGAFTSVQGTSKTSYIPFYLDTLFTNARILLLIVPLGIWGLFRENKRIALVTLASLAFLGPVFLSFAGLPMTHLTQKATGERFFMQSLYIIFFLGGCGINLLWVSLVKVIKPQIIAGLTGATMLLILVSYTFLHNYPKISQKNLPIFETYASNMLNTLPQNAIFLTGSTTTDTGWMGGNYMQQVKKMRVDTKIVNLSLLPADWYRGTLSRYYPDIAPEILAPYPQSKDYVQHLCTARIPNVYMDGWSPGIFPGEIPECLFIMRGLLIQLVPNDYNVKIEELKRENDKIWGFYDLSNLDMDKVFDYRNKEILLSYAHARTTTGIFYLMYNKEEWAFEEFEKALELSRDDWQAAELLSARSYDMGDPENAIKLEKQSLEAYPDNPEAYLRLGTWYFEKKDTDNARLYLNKYINRFPDAKNRQEVEKFLNSLGSF